MGYVMSLEPGEFLDLLVEAAEKRREEQARQEWLTLRPWMTEKTFVPFDRFYQRLRKAPSSATWRPREEVLAEVEAIRRAAKTELGGVRRRGDF